jgi:hypothetical protein
VSPSGRRALEAAIEAADVHPAVYRVLRELYRRLDWTSDAPVIADRWQPRSVDDLAARCRMSTSTAKRAIREAERLGWLTREWDGPGRGHAMRYTLAIGRDQPARPPEARPLTGAERTRRWRAGKRGQPAVTERGHAAVTERGQPAVTPGPERGQIDVTPDTKRGQIDVSKGFTARHTSAGQRPVSAGRNQQGGSGEGAALTITIAGRVHLAVTCGGCGELAPAKFTWCMPDGRPAHATCSPPGAKPWTPAAGPADVAEPAAAELAA